MGPSGGSVFLRQMSSTFKWGPIIAAKLSIEIKDSLRSSSYLLRVAVCAARTQQRYRVHNNSLFRRRSSLIRSHGS